jgi:tight adherence protein B
MWPIAVLLFACTFWVVYFVMARIMAPRIAVTERLSYYSETLRRSAAAPGRWSDIPTADRLMGRVRLAQSIELLLDQADLPIKPFELILMTVVAALVMGIVGLLFHRTLTVVMALGMGGGLTPLAWVYLKRSRRREAFVRQIPEALQAISNALRAGFGFGQGMTLVATDLPVPISTEFARAQREMNLGLSVDEVLQNIARRMQSADFDLAVTGILINRQVGGNLAELLDQVSQTIRERVRLKNFIRVITAQQRLSAWIVMGVPPILAGILFVGMREYAAYLLGTTAGHIMMLIAAFMQFLGMFFIRRIVAIDV